MRHFYRLKHQNGDVNENKMELKILILFLSDWKDALVQIKSVLSVLSSSVFLFPAHIRTFWRKL